MHLPELPLFAIDKAKSVVPLNQTALHRGQGRGTPHNKYRSEQNQHYCSALQDNAVGSIFLFSLNAKGNPCSHDISPSIIPFFLAQQEILNQLSSNSKTLTPHSFCENKQADYGDTRGSLPQTKGCCATAVMIFYSG